MASRNMSKAPEAGLRCRLTWGPWDPIHGLPALGERAAALSVWVEATGGTLGDDAQKKKYTLVMTNIANWKDPPF